MHSTMWFTAGMTLFLLVLALMADFWCYYWIVFLVLLDNEMRPAEPGWWLAVALLGYVVAVDQVSITIEPMLRNTSYLILMMQCMMMLHSEQIGMMTSQQVELRVNSLSCMIMFMSNILGYDKGLMSDVAMAAILFCWAVVAVDMTRLFWNAHLSRTEQARLTVIGAAVLVVWIYRFHVLRPYAFLLSSLNAYVGCLLFVLIARNERD